MVLDDVLSAWSAVSNGVLVLAVLENAVSCVVESKRHRSFRYGPVQRV